MPSSKTIKKLCLEAFQIAAFSTPIFVTGQKFATKACYESDPTGKCVNSSASGQEYWLYISAIIAYVAGVTLLLWLPLKVLVVWKKIVRPYEGLWFPGNLFYIIFSFVPCVAFVLLGHENCPINGYCFDYFRGAPIETMIIMMVVTDWAEKIRYIKLRSGDDSIRTRKYPYADVKGNQRSRHLDYSTSAAAENAFPTASRRSSVSQRSLLQSSRITRGTFRQRFTASLKWTDGRPENLLRDLMLAYDTRLVLGLSLLSDGQHILFQTNWVYSIYILSTVSLLPLVFAPNSEMRSSMTVILQDVPFFILRVAVFSYFGKNLVVQTSVLFLLKNFFAALVFIYFNVILPWRIAKQKDHEYELEQIDSNAVDNTTTQQYSRSLPIANAYQENQFGVNGYPPQADGGYTNLAYQSRRYESSRREDIRRRSSRYQRDEYQWNERDNFGDDPDDDELYPSRHHLSNQSPQIARVERHPSEEYPTYHEPPDRPSEAIQQPRFGDDQQQSPSRENSAKPKTMEINYDTLNDPNSFLYNSDQRQERRSVKPKVYNIDFEGSASQTPVSPQQQQPTPATGHVSQPSTSTSSNLTSPSQQPRELGNTDANTSDPTRANASASQLPEPTYAAVDHSKKTSRRTAPPPPTARNPQTQTSMENLPPPPPEIMNGDQSEPHQETMPSQEASGKPPLTRQGTLYTPNLARQLAGEAINRKRNESQKQEKEAMQALEDATEYGRQMINSRSTTPKSTYSGAHGVAMNDDEYDDRL